MEFTVKIEITRQDERYGDVVVSGVATVNGRKATAGRRLTAAELRGGATVEGAEEDVAGRLGKLACRMSCSDTATPEIYT